jgi:hypothetical protein
VNIAAGMLGAIAGLASGNEEPVAVDMWARVLAIAGLVASFSALTWQVVQWRLNGARVTVSLRVYAEVAGGHFWSDTFEEQADKYEIAHRSSRTGVEVQVLVRNRGRAPVHVEDYWLSINGVGERRMGSPSVPDPTLPYELKPGASVRFTQSISQFVGVHDDYGTGPYSVRARVDMGDGRSCWSPRSGLVIPPLD